MIALPNHSDYITSIETPQLIKAEELRGGRLVLKNGKPLRYAGGFCIVFPYILPTGKKVAVRCWTAHVPDAEMRSYQISQQLKQSSLPYFVGFDFIKQGLATPLGVFPIVIMDWVEAIPLKDYLKSHINDSVCLNALSEEFYDMVVALHKAGYSHGDLQHGNIMVSQTGKLHLVDYDSMFVPGLEGLSDEIKGLAGYQHPGRCKLKNLSHKSDYFSELIIYTSLLALSKNPSLWKELKIEDTETLVFTQEDIDSPLSSTTFRQLKSDPDLSSCIEAIEKAIFTPDIEDLLPLEEAIIPTSAIALSKLKDKWSQPTMVSKPQPMVSIDALTIKWNNPIVQKTKTPNVDSITHKWRK